MALAGPIERSVRWQCMSKLTTMGRSGPTIPYRRDQVALGVLQALGGHGAVQRQHHAIQRALVLAHPVQDTAADVLVGLVGHLERHNRRRRWSG